MLYTCYGYLTTQSRHEEPQDGKSCLATFSRRCINRRSNNELIPPSLQKSPSGQLSAIQVASEKSILAEVAFPVIHVLCNKRQYGQVVRGRAHKVVEVTMILLVIIEEEELKCQRSNDRHDGSMFNGIIQVVQCVGNLPSVQVASLFLDMSVYTGTRHAINTIQSYIISQSLYSYNIIKQYIRFPEIGRIDEKVRIYQQVKR